MALSFIVLDSLKFWWLLWSSHFRFIILSSKIIIIIAIINLLIKLILFLFLLITHCQSLIILRLFHPQIQFLLFLLLLFLDLYLNPLHIPFLPILHPSIPRYNSQIPSHILNHLRIILIVILYKLVHRLCLYECILLVHRYKLHIHNLILHIHNPLLFFSLNN